jgi:hypothetical protein
MPDNSGIRQEAQTMVLSCLPRCVSECLRVLRPCFRHRHHLVFSWLLVLHLVYGERANLKALARHGPTQLAYQHYRRLLCAAYWCTKTLLMLRDFRPPTWCQEIVVVADAAYASRTNLALIQELGYWYVLALPRTWKCTNGKALNALVTHLPRWWYTQIRIPTVSNSRRRTFWVYAKRARLRQLYMP